MRYADDLLVLCKSAQQAEAALARLRALLAELGLEPKEAKTRIVHLEVSGDGFDFLGSTTDWSAAGPAKAAGRVLRSLPAGPRPRRWHTPETGSGD